MRSLLLLISLGLTAGWMRAAESPHLLNTEHLTQLPYRPGGGQFDQKILEQIFREPCWEIRRAVLAGYLEQMVHWQMGATLTEARKLDGRLEDDELVTDILEVMAEQQPGLAFVQMKSLLKTINPVERFLDSYEDETHPINLANIEGAASWMGSGTPVAGFLRGLNRSKMDPEGKTSLRSQLTTAWDRYFGEHEELMIMPTSKEEYHQGRLATLAQCRAEILPLFTQTAELMKPAMQRGAKLDFKEMVLCAMIRWYALEPTALKTMLPMVENEQFLEFPEHKAEEGRSDPRLWIMEEFFRHWARQDAAAALEGLAQIRLKPMQLSARRGLIAFAPAETRAEWLKALDEHNTYHFFRAWSGIALEDALPEAALHGESALGACLNLPDQHTISIKEHVAACQPYLLKVTEDHLAWYALEGWGDFDSELTVSIGIDWLLKKAPERKAALLKEWTNQQFVPDGGLEDRVFGNLRYWACTQPKAMALWIAKQPDAEVRAALTWLLEHAKGGLPPAP